MVSLLQEPSLRRVTEEAVRAVLAGNMDDAALSASWLEGRDIGEWGRWGSSRAASLALVDAILRDDEAEASRLAVWLTDHWRFEDRADWWRGPGVASADAADAAHQEYTRLTAAAYQRLGLDAMRPGVDNRALVQDYRDAVARIWDMLDSCFLYRDPTLDDPEDPDVDDDSLLEKLLRRRLGVASIELDDPTLDPSEVCERARIDVVHLGLVDDQLRVEVTDALRRSFAVARGGADARVCDGDAV